MAPPPPPAGKLFPWGEQPPMSSGAHTVLGRPSHERGHEVVCKK